MTKTSYISVSALSAPVASFISDVTTGSAPLTVTFTDPSTNTPTSRTWDFGDGYTSTEENPEYEYEDDRTYTVTLTATNSAGSDTVTGDDYIIAGSVPVASFTAGIRSGTAPLTVEFTDTADNGPTSWYWSFGDGYSSSSDNPTHTYSGAGY